MIIAVAVMVARRPDRLTVLIGLTVLSVAFFVVPTRVHERYMFPFFALGAILAAISWRWLAAYVALSVVTFANLYVVLTTLYPNNPGISDWLGIGPGIRSTTTVIVIALVNLAGFLWICTELRGRAQRRLLEDIERSRVEDEAPPPRLFAPGPIGVQGGAGLGPDAPAPAGAAFEMPLREPMADRDAAPPARPAETGILAAASRFVSGRPLRADRSRALHDEPGGRFDRLDAWLVIVLVVGSLVLRTFRLSEPYSMHFDEVYHARTATEFLQDWRYGMPHDIYEYTHPHLAKYSMAAGLVLLGDDQVTSTAELGVPVRDAVVEGRWDDTALPGARAGDRLYVATPDDVRAYDLQSRLLVATIAVADPTTLAIDDTAHRLYIGTGAGEVSVLDTRATFDELRVSPGAPATGPPAPFASVGSAVRAILAPTSSPYVEVATAGDDLISFDAQGTETSRVHLPGIRQLEQAGSSQQVVVQPALVTDPVAAASLLAGFLGADAAELRSKIQAGASTVVLGAAPLASARTSLDQAIADGKLPGVNVSTLPQVVALDTAGLSFVIPSTATVAQTLTIEGATGMAYVTGLDSPRLYVAAGSKVDVVRLPSDPSTGSVATIDTTLTAPGPVEQVAFDPSTTFVHVLGRTPDGASPTVYVIEPHGNAFFADAKLPFDGVALAVDAEPLYPSQDRQQLLVLSADGGNCQRRHRRQPVRLALPRGAAGGADGRAALCPCPAAVPAALRRRPGRGLRAGRRHVVRAVADRHERRLRRLLHPRRVHALRRGLVTGPAARLGVLAVHARDRGPAGPRPGIEVGGALRHRRDRHPGPGPLGPRPAAHRPGDDRRHDRPGLHGPRGSARRDQRRKPHLHADHDRADPGRRPDRRPPPGVVVGRGGPFRDRRAAGHRGPRCCWSRSRWASSARQSRSGRSSSAC